MHLLIDMLTFALELHTTIIAPFILDSLLPVAQDTVNAVVISRYKSTIELETWAEDIDPTPTMHLLYLTAQGCMSEPENIKRFWKQMHWKFIPVLISPNQTEADYLISLKLLSTSVMKESFGAICGVDVQPIQMDLIINQLLFNIYEIPFKWKSNEHMSPDQLYRLRFHTLQLLISMTRSPVASRAMAVHQFAIGKLVHLVSDQLDELYDYKSNNGEWYISHLQYYWEYANFLQCTINRFSNAINLSSRNKIRRHQYAAETYRDFRGFSKIPTLLITVELFRIRLGS